MAQKVIKRYQNRKLYDTEASSYVTLDQIAKMIRKGLDVVVIDNRSKTDITAVTLTQLLYETEKKYRTHLPQSVPLLKSVIAAADGSFSGFIESLEMGSFPGSTATGSVSPTPQVELISN